MSGNPDLTLRSNNAGFARSNDSNRVDQETHLQPLTNVRNRESVPVHTNIDHTAREGIHGLSEPTQSLSNHNFSVASLSAADFKTAKKADSKELKKIKMNHAKIITMKVAGAILIGAGVLAVVGGLASCSMGGAAVAVLGMGMIFGGGWLLLASNNADEKATPEQRKNYERNVKNLKESINLMDKYPKTETSDGRSYEEFLANFSGNEDGTNPIGDLDKLASLYKLTRLDKGHAIVKADKAEVEEKLRDLDTKLGSHGLTEDERTQAKKEKKALTTKLEELNKELLLPEPSPGEVSRLTEELRASGRAAAAANRANASAVSNANRNNQVDGAQAQRVDVEEVDGAQPQQVDGAQARQADAQARQAAKAIYQTKIQTLTQKLDELKSHQTGDATELLADYAQKQKGLDNVETKLKKIRDNDEKIKQLDDNIVLINSQLRGPEEPESNIDIQTNKDRLTNLKTELETVQKEQKEILKSEGGIKALEDKQKTLNKYLEDLENEIDLIQNTVPKIADTQAEITSTVDKLIGIADEEIQAERQLLTALGANDTPLDARFSPQAAFAKIHELLQKNANNPNDHELIAKNNATIDQIRTSLEKIKNSQAEIRQLKYDAGFADSLDALEAQENNPYENLEYRSIQKQVAQAAIAFIKIAGVSPYDGQKVAEKLEELKKSDAEADKEKIADIERLFGKFTMLRSQADLILIRNQRELMNEKLGTLQTKLSDAKALAERDNEEALAQISRETNRIKALPKTPENDIDLLVLEERAQELYNTDELEAEVKAFTDGIKELDGKIQSLQSKIQSIKQQALQTAGKVQNKSAASSSVENPTAQIINTPFINTPRIERGAPGQVDEKSLQEDTNRILDDLDRTLNELESTQNPVQAEAENIQEGDGQALSGPRIEKSSIQTQISDLKLNLSALGVKEPFNKTSFNTRLNELSPSDPRKGQIEKLRSELKVLKEQQDLSPLMDALSTPVGGRAQVSGSELNAEQSELETGASVPNDAVKLTNLKKTLKDLEVKNPDDEQSVRDRIEELRKNKTEKNRADIVKINTTGLELKELKNKVGEPTLTPVNKKFINTDTPILHSHAPNAPAEKVLNENQAIFHTDTPKASLIVNNIDDALLISEKKSQIEQLNKDIEHEEYLINIFLKQPDSTSFNPEIVQTEINKLRTQEIILVHTNPSESKRLQTLADTLTTRLNNIKEHKATIDGLQNEIGDLITSKVPDLKSQISMLNKEIKQQRKLLSEYGVNDPVGDTPFQLQVVYDKRNELRKSNADNPNNSELVAQNNKTIEKITASLKNIIKFQADISSLEVQVEKLEPRDELEKTPYQEVQEKIIENTKQNNEAINELKKLGIDPVTKQMIDAKLKELGALSTIEADRTGVKISGLVEYLRLLKNQKAELNAKEEKLRPNELEQMQPQAQIQDEVTLAASQDSAKIEEDKLQQETSEILNKLENTLSELDRTTAKNKTQINESQDLDALVKDILNPSAPKSEPTLDTADFEITSETNKTNAAQSSSRSVESELNIQAAKQEKKLEIEENRQLIAEINNELKKKYIRRDHRLIKNKLGDVGIKPPYNMNIIKSKVELLKERNNEIQKKLNGPDSLTFDEQMKLEFEKLDNDKTIKFSGELEKAYAYFFGPKIELKKQNEILESEIEILELESEIEILESEIKENNQKLKVQTDG